jgi:glycosyl transferase family 25
LRIYLINLARRPDRLATMLTMASSLGLDFERIDAVDACIIEPAAMDRYFFGDGPIGGIGAGDKCCLLSHRLFWERLVASGDGFAVVLEDDAVLTSSAPRILNSADWIPSGVDVVKLEQFGRDQRILVSDFRPVAPGFKLAALKSRHTGTGGYILSRAAAQILLAITKFDLPVDHLLFSPNTSRLFHILKPQQLIPAVLRQQNFVGAQSDIEISRTEFRRPGRAYAIRKLKRFASDLRLLPRQLVAALTGRAQFIRILTDI